MYKLHVFSTAFNKKQMYLAYSSRLDFKFNLKHFRYLMEDYLEVFIITMTQKHGFTCVIQK